MTRRTRHNPGIDFAEKWFRDTHWLGAFAQRAVNTRGLY
jgi:hypothetical protein